MLSCKKEYFPEDSYLPRLERTDQRALIFLSLLLIIAMDVIFSFLVQIYYLDSFYEIGRPGFWILLLNSIVMYALFLFTKRTMGWQWQDVGLSTPVNWLKTALSSLILIAGLALLIFFLQPVLNSWTSPPPMGQFAIFEGNLLMLVSGLIYAWFHGAFLQELVFRALFINSFNMLLGHNRWITFAAVLSGSVVFGLIHAWQGLGGIILTMLMGLLFGTVYVLNGRKLWPLILVHGLLDTLILLSFYYGLT